MNRRQIILDTETTGLSPQQGHRIIEVGCLEMINRRLTKRHFHYYINPEREIDRAAEQVHGINSTFLADKPRFAEIVNELLEYLKGAELIIHNAPFDVGFLNYEFHLAGIQQKVGDLCEITDTLGMARRKHHGQQNSLDALCRRYQVDNSNRELHGALLDAELLAQVYLTMTGGQANLFNSLDKETTIAREKITAQTAKKDRQPLPIISAKQDELAAHQDYLEMMCRQGRCVWEEN